MPARNLRRAAAAVLFFGPLTFVEASGCSAEAVDEARDQVCEEIEKLPVEEVQRRVDQAVSELDKRGVKITIELWQHRDRLIRWMNEVRRFLGCRDLSNSAALSTATQALHEGGPADYCGLGHGDGLVLHVSYCVNEACRRHDSCYARCSEPTSGSCMWSAPTRNCDDAFFDQSSSCSVFELGTILNTVLVRTVARGMSIWSPDSGCIAGMKCPATTGQFGYGPCSINREAPACKLCLQRNDPGLECRTRVCSDEPTPEDIDICYTANCHVSECYGWSKETATPPPPPPDSCAAGCSKGFFCSSSTMKCEVDPLKNWVITLGSGKALDADGTGDGPDTQVCLTYDGRTTCTEEASDTHEPKWSTVFPPTSSFTLLTGVRFTYIDIDVAFDDTICTGTMILKPEDFKNGTFKWTCPGTVGDWFAGKLTPE